MKTNGRTRVVVTGMGTINPIGKTLDEYWDGLIEGRSGESGGKRRDRVFARSAPSRDP